VWVNQRTFARIDPSNILGTTWRTQRGAGTSAVNQD
jgi:hypothetical protein